MIMSSERDAQKPKSLVRLQQNRAAVSDQPRRLLLLQAQMEDGVEEGARNTLGKRDEDAVDGNEARSV